MQYVIDTKKYTHNFATNICNLGVLPFRKSVQSATPHRVWYRLQIIYLNFIRNEDLSGKTWVKYPKEPSLNRSHNNYSTRKKITLCGLQIRFINLMSITFREGI